jgi:hypothetical protein
MVQSARLTVLVDTDHGFLAWGTGGIRNSGRTHSLRPLAPSPRTGTQGGASTVGTRHDGGRDRGCCRRIGRGSNRVVPPCLGPGGLGRSAIPKYPGAANALLLAHSTPAILL